MFENRATPLLSRRKYLERVGRSVLLGAGMLFLSLLAGMAGYHYLENLPWLDAYVNAAMILSGMGPLANPQSPGGKFFAGTYALYSGLLLLSVAGVMFAPVVHRFLHRFHLEAHESPEGDEDRGDGAPPGKGDPPARPIRAKQRKRSEDSQRRRR